MPKSLLEAEEALGLTERVREREEEKERERSRRVQMEMEEMRRSGTSTKSGGGTGGGGGREEWREGGDGREGELRAPQPRYIGGGGGGSDTGYDSDSRSVFGSYDPEVRGTRIFEEQEEEEDEDGEGNAGEFQVSYPDLAFLLALSSRLPSFSLSRC